MITAMSLTNGTLTVVRDNGAEILTARNDHPKWNEIVEAFKLGNEALLQSLISLKAVVESYSVGELSVNSTGVTFRGRPMHSVDSNRVMAFLHDGLPFKPLANYMSRKMANPSSRAINEMYNFLEHKNMPITPEGKIIAYKGVRSDFYSVASSKETVVIQGKIDGEGHILNEVGTVIEVERSSVDDDFRKGCSHGLHAGSLSYARGWGQRVVLVEIDPADVVSVPEDCNCQKLRCCKYKVIGEYTGPMPDTFTDEFSEDEDVCNECGLFRDDCECDETCEQCGYNLDDCECGDSCDCGESSCSNCGPDAAEAESEQPPIPNADESNSSFEDASIPNADPDFCPACDCVEYYTDFACSSDDPPTPNPVNQEKMDVATRCKNIVCEQLLINSPEEVTDNTSLVELGADSLDAVELTMTLEDEFGIEIDDNDVEELYSKTFSDIVNYIYNRLYPATTSVTTDEREENKYLQGMRDGAYDHSSHNPPKYLPGDQAGADSDLHAQYIDGYVNGYN